ncbi:putative Ntn-hydrolase superfamily protein [Microbacteriaceae bacterium SG_E_30_P1]|uniref:Ntn-hydrolase superfamily protein n=1 Tax=Antiquaquibacter oligotrophicus TaxID=2880260 RepID=A0ABT6KRN4_9MICO|nr:DUF1028 domain-containing protein [Antiquaquibacter oligotrophicus]MDH6182455.1 putative Ntn-hydrolase superfamily protein [Antiquaquibacter oligotrophicus]UDF14574.1 DUF1028 domain-containing protein [Antiquaquibacter oligotrophicus]
MTYSIVAVDADAGQMGVAVQSHYFGVGSLVPWARPGVGVVATQSVVRAAYGPILLDLVEGGATAADALAEAVAADPGQGIRQVAVLSASGDAAAHTGDGCIAAAGHIVGEGFSAQANLVTGSAVWLSMAEAFTTTSGDLAHRLLASLDAAQSAGGDLRGMQAAAVRIVSTIATGDLATDTILDIRVDDHEDPLRELRRLSVASGALAGLVRMLEEPGLLSGPMTAAPGAVVTALQELETAQTTLGPANGEPSIWAGLLLARLGRPDAAASRFRRAASSGIDPAPLLRSLAAAGMWTGDPEDLVALATERPS